MTHVLWRRWSTDTVTDCESDEMSICGYHSTGNNTAANRRHAKVRYSIFRVLRASLAQSLLLTATKVKPTSGL